MSLVTLVEISRLAGISTPAAVQLVNRGFIRPVEQEPMRFHVPTLIGCCLSAWLAKKDRPRRECHSVMVALGNYSEAGLLRYFETGKTHLLIVNNLAGPVLVAKDAATGDPEIAPMLAAAKREGLKVEVTLLDVEAAYSVAKRRLIQLRSKRQRKVNGKA